MQTEVNTISQLQRKSLDEISPKEYQHYFFVQRLLLIFPPDKQDQKIFRFRYSGIDQDTNDKYYSDVLPKCMYDALISMHATCCEHSNQFFPYWHRWLMTKFEGYLLKAHQEVLSQNLVDNHAKRLFELARIIDTRITLAQIQKLLVNIQQNYKDLIAGENIKYIPAHYWNVFKPGQDINYPIGFISKDAYKNNYPKRYTSIDRLIRLIWEQDSIFEINLTRRFNFPKLKPYTPTKPQNYTEKKNLLTNYQFWAKPQSSTKQYLQFAYNFIKEDYSQLLQYEQHVKRLKGYNQQNLNIIQFNVYDTNILNYVFGGKNFQFYRIVENNVQNQGDNDTTLTPKTFKKTRNDNIGYYTYCRSLQTKPIDFMKKFCTTANASGQFSMENPHNQMHNDQEFIMFDGAFSITNPIFFAYHSLIDLMLDHKIQSVKNQNQRFGVQSVQQHMSQPLTIHIDPDDPNRGQSNMIFKQNWARYILQTQNKNPTNLDYPITKWVSINGSSKNSVLSPDDFLVDGNYTYQSIILRTVDNKVDGMKTLKQFINVDFQKTTFSNTMNKILPYIPGPYSDSGLYVALQVTHKSTIKSHNLVVALKSLEGKILSTKTQPIFSKGSGAKKCPNCKQHISRTILFPIEEFQPHFGNLRDIKNNGQFALESFSQVQSQVNIASSLSYELSNKNVTARFVTGRKNIKIRVVDEQGQKADVKVYLKTEQAQRYRKKAKELKRTKKYYNFNSQEGVYKQIKARKNVNIIGVQAQINGKPLIYNFPYYSDRSSIVINLGKKQKIGIGLSKKAQIGQPLSRIYEKTDKIQKFQFQQQRATQQVEEKLETITITNQDCQ